MEPGEYPEPVPLPHEVQLLPPPQSDDAFDKMVRDVVPIIEKKPHLRLVQFATRGQTQHGLDGYDPLDPTSLVYQATLEKPRRQWAKLLRDLATMDTEWPWKPSVFVYAVGTPRDGTLQEKIATLSELRATRGLCRVKPLFWNEIFEAIMETEELRIKYYRWLDPRADLFRERLTLMDCEPAVDSKEVMSRLDGYPKTLPDGGLADQPGLLWHARQLVARVDAVGWAGLCAIVDDGLDPVHPLDHRRIQRVVCWEILDRNEITPRNFDGCIYYTLPITDEPNMQYQPGYVIHESRLRIFEAQKFLPREIRDRAVHWMLTIEFAAREGPTKGIVPTWMPNWSLPKL
jgi:hypothetical protein